MDSIKDALREKGLLGEDWAAWKRLVSNTDTTYRWDKMQIYEGHCMRTVHDSKFDENNNIYLTSTRTRTTIQGRVVPFLNYQCGSSVK